MLSAFIRTTRLFGAPKLATSWATEFIDDRIATPRHRKHVDYYAKRKFPIVEAISDATGVDITMVKSQLNNLPNFLVNENQNPGMKIKWSATSELAAITYILVRLLKPISSVQGIRSLEFNVKSLAKELSYVSDVFHLREVIQKHTCPTIPALARHP